MKNILTLITVMLLSITAYTQEPTKQETIDWIAGKMYSNSSDAIYYSRCDGGSIYIINYRLRVGGHTNGIVSYHCHNGETISNFQVKEPYMTIKVDLNHIFEVNEFEKDGVKNLEIKGKNVLTQLGQTNDLLKLNSEDESIKTVYNVWNINHKSSTSFENGVKCSSNIKLIDFNAEPDLFNRMLKAFQTLAKYNNAEKPKEKF